MSFRKITVKSGNEEFTLEVTEEEYLKYYRPWWQQKKHEQRKREAMEQNGYTEESYEAWRDNVLEEVGIPALTVQFAGVYVRLPENRLVFPVTAYNAVHDAVHAGVHELVQCRIFFQSNPSFRGVVAYLCFGGLASGKINKILVITEKFCCL